MFVMLPVSTHITFSMPSMNLVGARCSCHTFALKHYCGHALAWTHGVHVLQTMKEPLENEEDDGDPPVLLRVMKIPTKFHGKALQPAKPMALDPRKGQQGDLKSTKGYSGGTPTLTKKAKHAIEGKAVTAAARKKRKREEEAAAAAATESEDGADDQGEEEGEEEDEDGEEEDEDDGPTVVRCEGTSKHCSAEFVLPESAEGAWGSFKCPSCKLITNNADKKGFSYSNKRVTVLKGMYFAIAFCH